MNLTVTKMTKVAYCQTRSLKHTEKNISIVLWKRAQNKMSFCLKQEQVSVNVVIKIKRQFKTISEPIIVLLLKKNEILMVFPENETS